MWFFILKHNSLLCDNYRFPVFRSCGSDIVAISLPKHV